jgi:carbohydrate-binding DOMON domain-containing protein
MKKTILILILSIILAAHSFAADKFLFILTDPIGDDYGPGAYVYPKNPVFKKSSFDLTGFEVSESKNDVIFKVYLKNRFTIPPDLQISNSKNLEDLFRTNLFLQNIDIYIDKDHKYNSGVISAIPGRNVKIAPESAWEQAIFISPQPFLARSEMKRLAKKIVDKVVVPTIYEVKENFIKLKIPKKVLGKPNERWGYLIVITGAEWETSAFSLSNWFKYGSSYEEPVLNRIVEKYTDEWQFGGGDSSGAAPNVIDTIVASGESQERMLGSYNAKTKKRAALSAVYPFLSTLEVERAVTPEVSSDGINIIDVIESVITIDAGRDAGLYAGKLGQVYDGNDTRVATVIVDEARDKISICTVIPLTQRGEIAAGMTVRFK